MTTATVTEAGLPEQAPPEAKLVGHAYDGIREYDNPLPGWWSVIFWATIVFAVAYVVVYHVAGWGQTPHEKYRAALAAYADEKGARDRAEAANVSDELLARRAGEPQTLADGHAVFVARCASCHADDGRGLIGPNLTDGYQLHGATRLDIYNTVKRGVPGTAMLAWGEQLAPADVIAVAAYVASLRGLNIAGKHHEGQSVEPLR